MKHDFTAVPDRRVPDALAADGIGRIPGVAPERLQDSRMFHCNINVCMNIALPLSRVKEPSGRLARCVFNRK